MAFYSTAIYLLRGLHLGQMQVALPGYPSPALWTQLLTALIVGLLTAFGFQLLLTNLGIALGLSSLAGRLFSGDGALNESDLDEQYRDRTDNSEEQSGSSSGVVGLVGFGSLLAVNVVLFAACFLATKFSQVSEPWGGAIVGLTIWSAYLLILIWVSIKTLNSVAGFIFDWATGGLRQMILAITAAFKPDEAKPITEAELLANIRQEIQMALSSAEVRSLIEAQLQTLTKNMAMQANQVAAGEAPMALPAQRSYIAEVWQPIEAYFSETNSKKLTTKHIDRKLRNLLQSAQEQLPEDVAFPAFPAAPLVTLLEQRDDLSEKKKQRIINQVEELWSEFAVEPLPTTNSDTNAVQSSDLQKEQNDDEEAEQEQPILQEILQPAVEKVINSTLTNLPGLIKGQNVSLSDGVAFAVLTLADALPRLQNSDELLHALPLDAAEMKPFLDRLLQEMQANLATLGQVSLNQAEHVRDLAIKPINSIQRGVRSQVSLLNQQARERVEATRKTAARATWWLFATISIGAISAALAGALASGARLDLVHWLHTLSSS